MNFLIGKKGESDDGMCFKRFIEIMNHKEVTWSSFSTELHVLRSRGGGHGRSEEEALQGGAGAVI